MVGVYGIFNYESGSCYIGSSVNMGRRWSAHKRLLAVGEHNNHHLQRAWNLYGPDAFTFVALQRSCKAELQMQEQSWLDLLKGRSYNAILQVGARPAVIRRGRLDVAQRRSLSERQPHRKLSFALAQQIREMAGEHSQRALARMHGVAKGTIQRILENKRYKTDLIEPVLQAAA